MKVDIKKVLKEKKLLVIGTTSVLVLIGIILSAYLYIRHTYNKDMLVNNSVKSNTTEIPEAADSNEQINYGVESDIVNVMLVGVDTRDEFSDSRTDSIIIASIDPTLKKVKLTSIMRDSYVEIPGKGYDKINAAFELGGIELLEKTIKYNFGLNVDNYVAIDFQGFQGLIDTLNGVELDVKDYEVKEINKYIEEVNGSNSTLIKSPGMQMLNGQQALSYCRIRKVGNNDYERTERQRRVLSLLLSKIKDTSVLSYPKLYSTISSYIKTNIPFESMLKIVYTVYNFGDTTTENLRIPVDGHFEDTSIDGQSVLIPELKYNATQFYKFIYNTVPENLTVPDNSKVYNQGLENKKSEDTEQKTNQVLNNVVPKSPQPMLPNTNSSSQGGNSQKDPIQVPPSSNTDGNNGSVSVPPSPQPETNAEQGTNTTTIQDTQPTTNPSK